MSESGLRVNAMARMAMGAMLLFAAAVACKPGGGWVPATGKPTPTPTPTTEPEPPLARELAQLKEAIAAKDPDALWKLLDPQGVECGDYLMNRETYDILVRRQDGRARPWVFGPKDDTERNVARYLETYPMVQTRSPDRRSVSFGLEGHSLEILYTRRDGRWIITEGLFCE